VLAARCERFAIGEPEADMVLDLKAGTPDRTTSHAVALIRNAQTVYCPDQTQP
jgi:hypothetical protein